MCSAGEEFYRRTSRRSKRDYAYGHSHRHQLSLARRWVDHLIHKPDTMPTAGTTADVSVKHAPQQAVSVGPRWATNLACLISKKMVFPFLSRCGSTVRSLPAVGLSPSLRAPLGCAISAPSDWFRRHFSLVWDKSGAGYLGRFRKKWSPLVHHPLPVSSRMRRVSDF